MGCHFGQGYLLAKPMPPGEAAEFARIALTSTALVPTPRH
jgi:EAL domain-containing protein (putative c-di-GMP-specific phosphodiesterase class I)